MKKIFLFTALILSIAFVKAQDEETYPGGDSDFKTIFGGKPHGGYGGLGLGYSEINGKSALLIDARGGFIFGHAFALGIAGSCFVNDYEYNVSMSRNVSLVGGYGGFFVEPIIAPKFFVHLSFPVLFGVGGIAYTTFVEDGSNNEHQSYVENTQTYILIEPAIELEFNLTKHMRMAAYTSYRWVSDLNWAQTPPQVLNNITVGLRFKFGKF